MGAVMRWCCCNRLGGESAADRLNYCFHDNEPLARYLVSDFVAHFGAYKALPGMGS